VARSDLLLNLIRAANHADVALIRRTVEALIADERAKQHNVFADRLAAALKQTKGTPVLIVTEKEGLAQKGATINFYIEENNVKFEINLDAVKAADLQISSKVLRVGKIIQSPKK